MKLYEINQEIQRIFDSVVLDEETGEIVSADFAALDELQLAKEEKLKNCGLIYLNRQAEAAAVKQEVDRLTHRYKRLASENKRLLDYMQFNLHGEEFSCPQFAVKYSKSTRVKVDDKFIEWAKKSRKFKNLLRTSYEPDKVAITNLLKSGKTLTYARLETTQTMKIK